MKLLKNIHSIAKNVLREEAEAILVAMTRLEENFADCVYAVLSCKGRIVVTGVGKSAIVATKIVATLNSTGTPAMFMHAADAIHGDLGMIQPDDIIMCISKSGNTAEIKVLVPLLKRMGSKLIALVGNTHSYLATQADFVLDATIDREACPHNLAPTTSTTLSMAIGDALAVCLLECRDFSQGDFARFHPGGSLGKRLYLKVSDVYPGNQLPMVASDASVREVIMEITSKRLGATAVVDAKQHLLGMITDGDLRRMLNRHENLTGLKASDIMTVSPKTIEPDAYAVEALAIMQEKNITQLIVLKDRQVAGFVHLHDLLREGLV